MPSFITTQVPLAPFTTLCVGGPAEFFASVETHEDLRAAVLWAQAQGHKITVLGGGSNMLVGERGVRGLVIHLTSQNSVYADEGERVQVTVDAGVVLDELINELVEEELWGLENLSAIPGTVGAVPVQNVGAYGVEGKDVITSVCAYDTVHDVFKIFSNTECAFAYRDSFFKTEDGAHYIITSVTFSVSKSATPTLSYKDLTEYFGANTNPTLSEIREAVAVIRSKKLPDWHTVGTAGSFFKNPIVSSEVFAVLKTLYPELPGFPEQNGDVKVSLGWILDKVCNLRGYREGNVGLYEKQALVLVCEKGSTAREVQLFVKKIIARVYERTGITIEPEVRMVE